MAESTLLLPPSMRSGQEAAGPSIFQVNMRAWLVSIAALEATAVVLLFVVDGGGEAGIATYLRREIEQYTFRTSTADLVLWVLVKAVLVAALYWPRQPTLSETGGVMPSLRPLVVLTAISSAVIVAKAAAAAGPDWSSGTSIQLAVSFVLSWVSLGFLLRMAVVVERARRDLPTDAVVGRAESAPTWSLQAGRAGGGRAFEARSKTVAGGGRLAAPTSVGKWASEGAGAMGRPGRVRPNEEVVDLRHRDVVNQRDERRSRRRKSRRHRRRLSQRRSGRDLGLEGLGITFVDERGGATGGRAGVASPSASGSLSGLVSASLSLSDSSGSGSGGSSGGGGGGGITDSGDGGFVTPDGGEADLSRGETIMSASDRSPFKVVRVPSQRLVSLPTQYAAEYRLFMTARREFEEALADSDENPWRLVRNDQHSRLYRRTSKSDSSTSTLFKGIGVFDAPPGVVLARLKDYERRHEWDDLYDYGGVVESFGESMDVAYVAYKAALAMFKRRDLLVFRGWHRSPLDGSIVFVARSVERESHPISDTHVRMEVLAPTGFLLTPIDDGNRTVMAGIGSLRLNGWIPNANFIQTFIAKRQPESMLKLRRVLEAEMARGSDGMDRPATTATAATATVGDRPDVFSSHSSEASVPRQASASPTTPE